MKMLLEEFKQHCDEYDGYCSECDEITASGDVEPDAEGRQCEQCELNTVMGVEQAMLKGLVEFEDEDESDSEDEDEDDENE